MVSGLTLTHVTTFLALVLYTLKGRFHLILLFFPPLSFVVFFYLECGTSLLFNAQLCSFFPAPLVMAFNAQLGPLMQGTSLFFLRTGLGIFVWKPRGLLNFSVFLLLIFVKTTCCVFPGPPFSLLFKNPPPSSRLCTESHYR